MARFQVFQRCHVLDLNKWRIHKKLLRMRPFECQPEKWPNEIVFDRLWYSLSILLFAAIGAKLIGPHGAIKVDK